MKRKDPVVDLVSAGGVVYRFRNGQPEIVVCGRSDRGLLSLPKGTPESGETREQTALREVAEETGLAVKIDGFIGEIDYWFVHPVDAVRCHKRVYYYLMTATGGDLSLHDHEFDTAEWVAADKARQTLTYENEAAIVQEALSLVSSRSRGPDRFPNG